MADVNKLTPLQRQWVVKSVSTQRDVLRRSLSKEMPGSEIYQLRMKEIQQLEELVAIFQS